MSDTLIDDIKIVISAEDKAAEGQIDRLIDKLEKLASAAGKASKSNATGNVAKGAEKGSNAMQRVEAATRKAAEATKGLERAEVARQKTAAATARVEEKHAASLAVTKAREAEIVSRTADKRAETEARISAMETKAAEERARLSKAFDASESHKESLRSIKEEEAATISIEKRTRERMTTEEKAAKVIASERERAADAEAKAEARRVKTAGLADREAEKTIRERMKTEALADKLSPKTGGISGGSPTVLDRIASAAERAGSALGKRFSDGAKNAAKSFGSFAAKALTFPFSAITSNIGKFGNSVSKLFSKIKSVIMYRAIRSAIRMVTDGFREGTNNAYQWSKAMGGTFAASMDSLATSSLYLKNSLGALATPIINAIAPAVDYVIDKFVALLNIINMTIARLTGASTWTKAIKYPKAYADAANQAAGSTGKLAKALVTILSIDELNPLNGDNGSGGGGGGGTGSALDYSSMFEEVEQTSGKLEGLFDPIKKAWDNKGQAVMDSIQNALNGVKSLVESVGASFWEVWTNGTGQQTVEHLLGIFTGINNTIGNIASQLAKGWNTDNLGTKIIQNLWDMLNSILSTWEEIATVTAEWAKGLDFVPILSAIENLTSKMKPLVDTITNGLSWAWTNVLLPLGKWTIEEGLPPLLDTLAEAIRLIGNVAEKVEPYAKKLWDNFLKPLATFTAGAWLSALESLRDVLKDINDVLEGKKTFSEFVKDLTVDLPKKLEKLYYFAEGVKRLAMMDFPGAAENLAKAFGLAQEAVGEPIAIPDPLSVNGASIKVTGIVDEIPAEKKKFSGFTSIFNKNGGTETGFSKTITGLIAKFTGKPVDGMTTGQKVLDATANFIRRTTNWTNPSIGTIWNATANFIKRTTNWTDGSTTWKSTANFTTRTDSLGASKKTFSTTASFSKVSDGLTTGQKSFYTTANFNKVSDGLTSGQKSFYSLANFNKVSDGLTTGQKSFYATANFNKAVNNLSEGQRTVDDGILKIRTLKLNGNTYTPINAKGGAFYGGSWHPISQYATGGVPDHGSLFMAGEAGAEVVGHVGGRTEVLNQSQIASTIAAATQMSNESQNGLLRQLLAVGEQILEGQGDVRAYIPAGEVVNGLQRNNRRDGRTLIPMGV